MIRRIPLALWMSLLTLACARDPAEAPDAADGQTSPDAAAAAPFDDADPETDTDAAGPFEDADAEADGAAGPFEDADAAPRAEPDATPLEDADAAPRTEPDAAPAADGTFARLYAEVFHPANCASPYCHPGDHDEGFEGAAFGRWLLTSESISFECSENPRPLVVPGDPEASLLYLKVAPGLEVCGEKMPLAGPSEGGLPPEQAERVRAWIADGARL
jgi:hypothetical protein